MAAPGAGGALCRFWSETAKDPIDWLRPIADAAIAEERASAMAAFPLIPFSNRIRDGRFRCGTSEVSLGRNSATAPHAIHGQGWQRPWTIVDASATQLELSLRHLADAWPWRYSARQTLALDSAGLTVEIALANQDSRPMPAGIGYHPYFPRTPRCRVTAGTGKFWRTDAEVMPVALEDPPVGADPRKGVLLDAISLDNNFTGWDGTAVIEWPERRARITMTASAPLSFLVLYSPLGRDFFALEPVSHCTDAFNLMGTRGDTGAVLLGPGVEISGRFRLEPGIDR